MEEADLDDFNEDDWENILEELRILVAASGFAGWDEAMIERLEEKSERPDQRWLLLNYLDGFQEFLTIQSANRRIQLQERLSKYVSLESGEPARDVRLSFEFPDDPQPDGERHRREVPLFSTEPSDEFIEELRVFRAALHNEEPSGYFDDGEPERST